MNDVSPRSTLIVTSAEVCDRGKVREENQDNVRSATVPLGKLFIVADGIGGYQGGATASRMVVDGFSSQLASRPANYPPDRALQEACDYTNTSIHSAAGSSDPTLQRMGSTVVLALVQTAVNGSPIAWIGHVGDSRAYLIRGGKMQKLTSDHSAVQALLSRNLITEDEARNHPDASVLTRSLGHRPEVEMEIDRVDLQSGDALLLCSDGLWGYVADADISTVATDSTLSVQTTAETLLHQALAAGGQDNIGIEFVRIGTAPAPGVVAAVHVEATNEKQEPRHRNQQLLAIGLLLLGGFGGLGYLAYSHGWWSRLNGSNQRDNTHKVDASTAAQTVTGTVPADKKRDRNTPPVKPATPEQDKGKNVKRIGVFGDVPEALEHHTPSPDAHVWQHVTIKRTERPACASLAQPTATVIYSDVDVNLEEVLDQHSELRPWIKGQSVQTHRMDARVKKDCGDFNAVVILPGKKTGIAPANEAPESSRPTEQQSQPSQQPSQDPLAEMLPPLRPAQSPARLQEQG